MAERDVNDLKQDVINALGLRGLQRRRLVREGLAKDYFDAPGKHRAEKK